MPEPFNFVCESGEPFQIYRLEDGTLIRMKVVLTRVTVREGETDSEGRPVYDLRYQQITDVTPGNSAMDTILPRKERS